MIGDPHMLRLAGLRVLVAEDEWMMASDIARALEEAGAIVLGPTATVEEAIAIAEKEQPDAALLDLKLADGMAYPAADMLLKRRVPVIFTTGYDAGSIPDRYASVPIIEKPVNLELLLERLAVMLRPKLSFAALAGRRLGLTVERGRPSRRCLSHRGENDGR